MYEWLETGLKLVRVIGVFEILENVTTCNYVAIANPHNLQFTTARTKSSQSTASSPVGIW
jgi:hypothetical protein